MPRAIRIEPNSPDHGFAWFGRQAGGRMWFPVTAFDTGGRAALQLVRFGRGQPTPIHRHTHEDEAVYVIEGELRAEVGGEAWTLGEGDLIFAPRGTPHRFEAASPACLTATAISPGAIEAGFREAAAVGTAAALRHELSVWGVAFADSLTEPAEHAASDRRPGVGASPAPFVVRAGEGPAVWLAGNTYTIKVAGDTTGGAYCLVHFRVPPGGGPRPHVHHRDEEVFHLLSGAASFYADGDTARASAGQTVVLPRGVPHGFRNDTDGEAEFLTLVSPAGFDRFALEVGTPTEPGQPPPAPTPGELGRVREASARYGVEMLPHIQW